MKYRKVMALLVSAGLLSGSLTSCGLMPQTAFGMEAETEILEEEDSSDDTKESKETPAVQEEQGASQEDPAERPAEDKPEEAVESISPDTSAVGPADTDQGEDPAQNSKNDDGGSDEESPHEDLPEELQEEVPTPQEETENTDPDLPAETSVQEETDTDSQGDKETADSERSEDAGYEPADTDAIVPVPAEEAAEPITEGPIGDEQSGISQQETEGTAPAVTETETEKRAASKKEKTRTKKEKRAEEKEVPESEEHRFPEGFCSSFGYHDLRQSFAGDFRFIQVDKVYGIADAARLARIYEDADEQSRIIGEIPYFALACVLDEKDGFYYIESGNVRGFIPKEDLTIGDFADDTVDLLGENAFEEAEADVEISDNAAFTFTKTTTHEVLADKVYAITYEPCSVLEYPKEEARTIGELANGSLVYVLKDAGDGWLFVESGDVRGFVLSDRLLTGAGAKAITEDIGEGTLLLAEEVIAPQENRSLYYTLSSVKPASGPAAGAIWPGAYAGGNLKDGSVYSREQLELIWAIVAQEDNGSYEGALAVISSAMNRTESPIWSGCGGDVLTQLTAPGQYCYSLDDYWRPRLGGNVPEYVKQAVNDCLVKGIRNHSHTSFRSCRGKTTGSDAVQIGGNWYFGA